MLGEPDSFPLGDFPSGRRLEAPNQPKGFVGTISTLPEANHYNLETAARFWTQANVQDFDRDGKFWVARQTGERYLVARGNPLLAQSPRATDGAIFLVVDDRILFLRRDGETPVTDSIPLGTGFGYST